MRTLLESLDRLEDTAEEVAARADHHYNSADGLHGRDVLAMTKALRQMDYEFTEAACPDCERMAETLITLTTKLGMGSQSWKAHGKKSHFGSHRDWRSRGHLKERCFDLDREHSLDEDLLASCGVGVQDHLSIRRGYCDNCSDTVLVTLDNKCADCFPPEETPPVDPKATELRVLVENIVNHNESYKDKRDMLLDLVEVLERTHPNVVNETYPGLVEEKHTQAGDAVTDELSRGIAKDFFEAQDNPKIVGELCMGTIGPHVLVGGPPGPRRTYRAEGLPKYVDVHHSGRPVEVVLHGDYANFVRFLPTIGDVCDPAHKPLEVRDPVGEGAQEEGLLVGWSILREGRWCFTEQFNNYFPMEGYLYKRSEDYSGKMILVRKAEDRNSVVFVRRARKGEE